MIQLANKLTEAFGSKVTYYQVWTKPDDYWETYSSKSEAKKAFNEFVKMGKFDEVHFEQWSGMKLDDGSFDGDYMNDIEIYQKQNEAVQSEEEKFFEERTANHIKAVQDAAAKIAQSFPELSELVNQAKVHDSSKLSEPERTPYISITWRHKLEKEKNAHDPINGVGYQTPGLLDKEDENAATLHHITTNSHHPEFHNKEEANIDSKDRDKSVKCIDASAMPDIDVAEMVADWQAMAEELKKNPARQWFEKQKDVRWHFSDHQVELIDKLLKVFE